MFILATAPQRFHVLKASPKARRSPVPYQMIINRGVMWESVECGAKSKREGHKEEGESCTRCRHRRESHACGRKRRRRGEVSTCSGEDDRKAAQPEHKREHIAVSVTTEQYDSLASTRPTPKLIAAAAYTLAVTHVKDPPSYSNYPAVVIVFTCPSPPVPIYSSASTSTRPKLPVATTVWRHIPILRARKSDFHHKTQSLHLHRRPSTITVRLRPPLTLVSR